MPTAFIQSVLTAGNSGRIDGKRRDKRMFKTDSQAIKSSNLREQGRRAEILYQVMTVYNIRVYNDYPES